VRKTVKTNTEAEREFSEKSGKLWLWTGLLLPPIAWAIQLQTVYLLSEKGCSTGNFLPNHIVSVAALLLSAAGFFVSWQNWLATGAESKNEKAGTAPRSSFMAILGIMTGGLFSLVIFAQWLPAILGVPCEK
jgi:hypothetical protein